MKCKSCGNELVGAAIICRACNHNNALHMRLAWRRPEPRHNQSTGSPPSEPLDELPTIVPRKDAEVNLLRFPSALNRRAEVTQATPTRQAMSENNSQTAPYPPWRTELKERVRRIKEKRAMSELVAPNPSHVQPSRAQVGEAKPGRNPIVEAALNRIRWASRERERQRDEATERRGDGATGGQRDFSQSLPVSLSPRLSVAQSPHRPVAQPPRPFVTPSPHPSVSPLLHLSAPPSLHPSVPPSRSPSQTSTGKPSINSPLTGAPDKHIKTRVSEIAQSLETPRPNANPAPLFSRLLAGACDFEIVLMAFLLIFGAYANLNNATPFGDRSRLLMALLLSAVVFIYQIVMLTFAGRTFGMALLKLNLVNTGDERLPVTHWQMLLRASAATIVFICFPLHLAAWLSASRRTLPDMVSGTTVA